MRGALLATQKGETQGEEPLITLLDPALRADNDIVKSYDLVRKLLI